MEVGIMGAVMMTMAETRIAVDGIAVGMMIDSLIPLRLFG
jgi:hypothetical protein